jgi:hypothetical protein
MKLFLRISFRSQAIHVGFVVDKVAPVQVFLPVLLFSPIPVDAPSKAWVCCRLLAGIAGSNSAGSMGVFVL